jgi:hypothetical protein
MVPSAGPEIGRGTGSPARHTPASLAERNFETKPFTESAQNRAEDIRFGRWVTVRRSRHQRREAKLPQGGRPDNMRASRIRALLSSHSPQNPLRRTPRESPQAAPERVLSATEARRAAPHLTF